MSEDFTHPIFGRVTHGVVVDETQIKPVPDGSKRLNESHGILFPIPDPGPVKMVPPRKAQGPSTDSDERNPCDTPEFIALHTAPQFPWMQVRDINSPEYREMCRTGITGSGVIPSAEPTDPLEQAGITAYHAAISARHLGQPFDAEIIALHQSQEWRNPNFRAEYYAKVRERMKRG